MSTVASYGVSRYVAREHDATIVSRTFHPDGTRLGIIYCHGSGGTAASTMTPTNIGEFPLLHALAERYPVVGPAIGSGPLWGNDLSNTRMSQVYAYIQTKVGAKAGKVILAGVSMGVLTALVWAHENPDSVAAVVGWLPAVDIADIHDHNRAGLRASINEHYGGSYDDAVQKYRHNPAYIATTGAYGGLPCRFYYASDDPIAIPATTTAIVAAIGSSASAVPLGPGGHSQKSVAHVPASDVLTFLAQVE
jgi:pimeloyl-ACP methyl ester carboxylesterase